MTKEFSYCINDICKSFNLPPIPYDESIPARLIVRQLLLNINEDELMNFINLDSLVYIYIYLLFFILKY